VEQLLSLFDLGEAELAVTTAARVIVILLISWLLQRIATRIIAAFHGYMSDRFTDAGRVRTVEQVLRNVATVVIVIVAGTLVLGELGISVLPILATAGVAGIAIGFGAQSLIKDYFTGFFLLLEDQLRQGDVVEIAGKGGTVEEVNLRHVRMRDFDGIMYFIPNSEIKLVVNRTRGHALAVIDAVIKSSQKVEEAFAVMREAGAELRREPAFQASILGDVEIAGIERWEPWGLVLRCRIRVVPHAQWSVRAEFLRRLKSAFEARGIQSP
jgi:small-conductance mechanosensitive channel